MAVYLAGLVMLTGAIELTLALLLASQGKVPTPSSAFWTVYLGVDIALLAIGGILVARGLGTLRSGVRAGPDDPGPPDRPAG